MSEQNALHATCQALQTLMPPSSSSLEFPAQKSLGQSQHVRRHSANSKGTASLVTKLKVFLTDLSENLSGLCSAWTFDDKFGLVDVHFNLAAAGLSLIRVDVGLLEEFWGWRFPRREALPWNALNRFLNMLELHGLIVEVVLPIALAIAGWALHVQQLASDLIASSTVGRSERFGGPWSAAAAVSTAAVSTRARLAAGRL